MKRVVGFLLGALLMLGLFLLALDAGRPPTLVKEVVSNETDIAERPEVPAEPAPGGASEPAATVPVGHSVDTAVLPTAAAASLDAVDQTDTNDSGLALDPQLWNQSMAAFETADRKEATVVSRYLVWSPFRSEWAAQGFAQRLTVATGVPVEVINAEPGNYQVIFNYRDDGERQAMVERIETVTGLELE